MGGIPFQKTFLHSTVYIKNSFNKFGTGVLVSRRVDKGKSRLLLITNKHIIQDENSTAFAEYIVVRFYIKDIKLEPKAKNIKIIIEENGQLSNRVLIHPENGVDIIGIIINDSDIVGNNEDINLTSIDESLLLTRNKMVEEVIEAGENVLILGYPAGIFSQENFLPIVKQGIIATSPQEDIKLRLGDKTITGKMILVEASLFGGSSGSPVFIKPRWKVKLDSNTGKQTVQLGEGVPVYLIGVQSSAIRLSEKIYIRTPVKGVPLNNTETVIKEVNPTGITRWDGGGEYFELNKEVMLNIVFSSEYILDLFRECDKRFPLR